MDEVTIGQYRVTRLIGRGGMGAVYAAEHALLGRPAAIKVLLPDLSQKQDAVQRFFNEARAATAIRHPGIVEIYDFGWTSEGDAFIVMERLEGETLARRASRAQLPWPAVLAIARQIAGALGAAHAKGIVHRDLKPDNVFLVPDPEVPGGERIKLLDFGIAKLATGDPATTMSVTRTGALIGTPTYMAPEQCRGVAIDHRADLYALGCVMYELCCGQPPFVGEGSGDVLAAHIHVPVPRMTGKRAEFPPAVEKLIRRLLAKAPADRAQSAEELIRAIDALIGERATTSTTIGALRSVPLESAPSITTLSGTASMATMPMQKARGSWPLVAVSAALAAMTVAVVIAVMRPGPELPMAPAKAPLMVVPAAEPASAPPADPPPSPSPLPAVSPPVADASLAPEPTLPPEPPSPAPPPEAPAKIKAKIDGASSGAKAAPPHKSAAPPHRATAATKPVPAPPATKPKPPNPDPDRSVNPFD